MRVVVLGADGYLGWPTALSLLTKGHEVVAVDNYLRREISKATNSLPLFHTKTLHERADEYANLTGNQLQVKNFDCCNYELLSGLIKDFQPECVIHYAEQPSAPYSMRGFNEASLTLNNNITSTFNLLFAVKEFAPTCHIIKLGTMGEYGTPNIDIEEGWININHKGRSDKFLYPRQGGSLYHTTKILDTDLIWFYVRNFNLRVTDLMQGPVYGLSTPECDLRSSFVPNFHYDDIFGTVINRFVTQAVCKTPLTVYGSGRQIRGYLNIIDTIQCVTLALDNPTTPGNLRILNQFTEAFSVNEIAEKIQRVGNSLGLDVSIEQINNPRKELENHYYNPASSGLTDLGLKPTLLTDDVISSMLLKVKAAENLIDKSKIFPRVNWV